MVACVICAPCPAHHKLYLFADRAQLKVVLGVQRRGYGKLELQQIQHFSLQIVDFLQPTQSSAELSAELTRVERDLRDDLSDGGAP